jgi:hypothetical protein
MASLVPLLSQLEYYPEEMVYRDSVGNVYAYGQDGVLRPLETTNGSDPANINVGNYGAVLEKANPGILKMIQDTQTPGESWIETLTKLTTAITMTAQQRQLMQLNIERAKKGLPPVDIASYSGVGVSVGLSPDTKNLLIFGGLALVAVFFLMRKK